MSWDIWKEATPEEEDELLKKAEEVIEKYKMEPLALIILETIKFTTGRNFKLSSLVGIAGIF